MVGTPDAQRRRQVSFVQDLSVPAGQQGQKATERGQILHGGHRPHVPFQIGLHVGTEPQARRPRPGHGLRIAAVQQAHPGAFPGRKRKELQHGRAARHGFRDALHERRFLRTGQKPLARQARTLVNARPHQRKHFGNLLHLIQDHGRLQRVEEPVWIRPQARDQRRIFQQEIGGPGQQVLEQPGLARASWTGEDHRRKIASGLEHLGFQLPRNVTHR